MRFFYNESMDPYFNQAYEEYIFNHYREGVNFLLWRNGPAVVCGAGQCVPAETNLTLAAREKVAVVRRPTGGGAVYHDAGNVNYTFMAPATGKHIDYARFLQPVLAILHTLGIEARIDGISELMLGDYKISGNAQKIAADRVWHHGTLLYDTDLDKLRQLANGKRVFVDSRATASRPAPVTNIRQWMAEPFADTEAFMRAFLAELDRAYGPLTRVQLSPDDLAAIRNLTEQKYRTWAWTIARGPAFTFRRMFIWRGAPLTVTYRAKRGCIETISFEPNHPEAALALRGVRVKRHDLARALEAFPDLDGLAPELF